MAKSIPVATPWTARRADAWDGMTLGYWLEVNCRAYESRHLFTSCFATIFGADPHAISLLQVAHAIRTCDGLEYMISTENGAQKSPPAGPSGCR
jgi:monoamine oxidase